MSLFQQQVRAAIGAHGMWKARLRSAIDTGASSVSVADIRPDNRCEFGQWLYGDCRGGFAAPQEWETVRALHAAFHSEAARVLEMALSGRKAEAEKAMGLGGAFSHASSALVKELTRIEKLAA